MGNKLTIKDYINEANKNIILDEKYEKKLQDLYPKIIFNYKDEQQQLYLGKNELKNLLQLSRKENFETIFEIFGEKNEKKEEIISYDNMKYLLYSFTEANANIKFILFSFLIFGDREYIEEKELKKIISHIFIKNVQLFAPFFNYAIKVIDIVNSKNKSSKKNHKNENELMIPRHDFIKNIKIFLDENLKILAYFDFIKSSIGTSEFKFNNINKNSLDFFCDCGKNIYISENNNNNLDNMKKVYKEKTNETNKVLYYTEIIKMLKEYKISQNIINIIIDYYKQITLKEYCYFEDIKDLFTNLEYSNSLLIKKNLYLK